MSKATFVRQIREYVELHRDPKTGIAWVEDGTTGMGHSAHPNIDATGSIRGMKNRGYWAKDARCVRSHGYIYNIDLCVVSDELDEIAAVECRCGGFHNRKLRGLTAADMHTFIDHNVIRVYDDPARPDRYLAVLDRNAFPEAIYVFGGFTFGAWRARLRAHTTPPRMTLGQKRINLGEVSAEAADDILGALVLGFALMD